jgi:hypothetical protein
MAESADGRLASNSAAENRFSDATEEDVFNMLTNINSHKQINKICHKATARSLLVKKPCMIC